MCFSPYLGIWSGGGGPMGLLHKLLMHFFQPIQLKNRNHLAEVVRFKARQAYIGENATYPPFWAYSRTLPQGVELLV